MKAALLVGAILILASGCSGELDGGGGGDSGTGGKSSGGGSAGKSSSGGNAGTPGGGGGNPSGGGNSGGASGSGGDESGGAASGTGGGSGGCVENLACQLDAPASSGDLHQDCVNRINQFRTECACLTPLERWTEGEPCADQMAQYDSERDEAHAGFQDEICDGGFGQNECPGYGSNEQVVSRCLQQMWDEGPPPQDPCNGACFQMYGHFINMTNPDHSRVACGFFTTASGDVWAVQNFAR